MTGETRWIDKNKILIIKRDILWHFWERRFRISKIFCISQLTMILKHIFWIIWSKSFKYFENHSVLVIVWKIYSFHQIKIPLKIIVRIFKLSIFFSNTLIQLCSLYYKKMKITCHHNNMLHENWVWFFLIFT